MRKKRARAMPQPQIVPTAFREIPMQIVPVGAPLPAMIPPPPSAEEILKRAEQQIQVRKGYIRLIAQNLSPHEVLVFGNKDSEEVYLPVRTCQNILSWAGVRIQFQGPMQEHRFQSPDGEFIEFVIPAEITPNGGQPVPVIGNRSTRDEFFGTAGKTRSCPVCNKPPVYDFPWEGAQYKGWFCKEHPKEKPVEVIHYLPLWDVDIASVRKAAVSNLWNSAVRAIGLQPTLKELSDAGMDIAKVKKVGFSEKKAESATPKAHGNDSAGAVANRTSQARTSTPLSQQAAASSASPGPPPAEIPSQDRQVKGLLKDVSQGTTKDKHQPYLRVMLENQHETFYCFDNKQMHVDADRKAPLFQFLTQAPKGSDCEFLVRNSGGTRNLPNIYIALKIGKYEWLADGTPVLRR